MDYEKLYITGEWIPGASGTFIDVENPATREIFARVPAGNAEDVDKAAKAAHAASLHGLPRHLTKGSPSWRNSWKSSEARKTA